MRKRLKELVSCCVAAFTVASCAMVPSLSPKSTPGDVVSGTSASRYNLAMVESLSHPKFGDWRSNLITSKQIQATRRPRAKPSISLASPRINGQRQQRQLMMMTNLADATTTSRISGAASWNYISGKKWWLTEDGNIVEDDAGNFSTHHIKDTSTPPVDTTDVFPRSSLSLGGVYADHVFVCSKSNKMYAIDMNSFTTTDIVDMSGSKSDVDFCPSPWVYYNDVYAVNNDGLLYHWTYNFSTGLFTQVATLQLPHGTSGSYTTYYRTSVVNYGSKLWVASWKKHSSTPNSDTGYLYQVDTSTFTLDHPGSPWTVGANFAVPSLELDDYGTPITLFVPGNKSITMIDLGSSTISQASSAPLVISATAAAGSSTGHPSSLNSTTGAGHRITSPVCINALDHSIYVTNCNAVWKLSYAAPDYDGQEYTEEAFSERADSLQTSDYTWYTLTYNGDSHGVIESSHYISNTCSPAWDEDSAVYGLDNYGQPEGSTYTALTKFTDTHDPNDALVYDSAYDLTGNAAIGEATNNEVGCSQLNYFFGDYLFGTSDALIFSTSSNFNNVTSAGKAYEISN